MEANDPYQPPKAPLQNAVESDPQAKLFKLSGIGIATFLGSLFAGGLLMAVNYRAMGRPDLATRAVWYSLIATIAVMALAMLLPDNIPSVVIAIPQLLAMMQVARQQQGSVTARREAAGLPMRSNWQATGIALLVLVALVVSFVAVLFGLQALGVPIDTLV